jgi:hypothetical protein
MSSCSIQYRSHLALFFYTRASTTVAALRGYRQANLVKIARLRIGERFQECLQEGHALLAAQYRRGQNSHSPPHSEDEAIHVNLNETVAD